MGDPQEQVPDAMSDELSDDALDDVAGGMMQLPPPN